MIFLTTQASTRRMDRRTPRLPARALLALMGAGLLATTACRDTGNGTTDPNLAPTATIAAPSAGASFAPGEDISFQGSASDPEDGALTGQSLTWTSSRDGQIGVGASFTRDDLSNGLHTITLRAEDSGGLIGEASVSVRVENQPPVPVIAGPQDGATFAVGADVQLVGTAVDAEDGTLTGGSLTWSSDEDGDLGTGSSLTVSDLSAGAHTLTLTATDSGGQEASVSVVITVRPPPTAAIALPEQGDQSVQGQSVAFEGSGSDPQDGALTGGSLVWTSTLQGQIGTGASFARSDLVVGSHTITLTATNSGGLAASASVGITVVGVGGAPAVSIQAPADGATLSSGNDITFQGTATDDEDGSLTGASLVWTSDVEGDIGTGTSFTIAGSTLSAGTHVITLTATDSDALTGTASVTITILSGPDVSISSPSNGATFDEGESITFEGSATDAEDGALTGADLVWTSSRDGEIGTGTSFSSSGLSGGSHVITLTATDSDGLQGSASRSITVQSGSPPSASISSPGNGTSVDVGTNVSFQGTASDPEDGSLSGSSLVWTSSQDGLIGTGTSFSRSALSVGSHTITLTATDSDGRSDSDSHSLTVNQTDPILVKVGSDAGSDVNVGQNTSNIPVIIDMSQAGGQDIASLQITITWNTGVASYVSSTAESGTTINDNDAGSGTLTVNWFDINGRTSNVTMMRLRLQGASAGSTNISVSVQDAADVAANDLSSDVGVRNHGLIVGN